MKAFSERNPVVLGAIGLVMVVGTVTVALEYKHLPFVNSTQTFSAYFAEAGGLQPGAPVHVLGLREGEVNSVELDGARVRVTFDVGSDVHLGDRTEAAIKTKSLLGAKFLEITPRGEGPLSAAIPVDRTTAPYQLPDALGDLSATISDLNTTQVSDALDTLSHTFEGTPANLRLAIDGVARFSKTLNDRDTQLRNLLANAKKTTAVLAERSDQVVNLIANTDALLAQLRTQSVALEQISRNISAFARQLSGFIADNRAHLHPALDKLNGVLSIVDNRKDRVQQAIKYLNQYALSLGESVASGPFFKAYVANLLPGQFVQPFVDAAFSDLGLDPNVLLPSQRSDPQVGQPGTPALPLPMPRTGQGGEPHLTLPDAITGKPDDPRYPYREPLPAPPPGGPPPGPPAVAPPRLASTPEPTPAPVYQPAPGESPAANPPGPTAVSGAGQ
ncbi:MCE family protein [Mycolicibacterium sp. ELW1]|uniref:MCE family protein n=1 Tax=Mycobacteriaceae TaxID=1762 RepID=UPI0011EDE5F0|nr:MCE family protein [Mycobacterium sp. ELW1]QEN16383.1 MCE family protein [Mycobacterium sp. ELW1]